MKRYKPTSNGLRQREILSHEKSKKPLKSLLKPLKKTAGRNNTGRITVRHRGGGSRRHYRCVDLKRLGSTAGKLGKIVQFEYDPVRTARLALIVYETGFKAYILAPAKSKIGDTIMAGDTADIKPGHALTLKRIPTGTIVHNVGLTIGGAGKLVRAGGAGATVVSKFENYASLKLPSGEIRKVHVNCVATVGQVGNADNRNQKIGKAGAKRWRGIRPTVRGAAMNATDHPHGGGEGKAPVGAASPRSKWGKPVFKKTRRAKPSSRLIVKRRK